MKPARSFMRTPPVLLGVLGALIIGCGARPEQTILDEFFARSRLHDKTALAKFATVAFEPQQRGIVVDYNIDKVAVDGAVKRVSLSARVKRPDGRITPEVLVVLMQRGETGWTITGVVETADLKGRPTPASR